MDYSVICIFASEDARWEGKPLADGLIALLRERRIAARCLVTRGVSGCYENGELATQRVEVLSYNLPLKIEIVLPSPEAQDLLPTVTQMVTEGIVGVSDLRGVVHKVKHQLIPRHLRVRDVMTLDPQRVRPASPLSRALEMLLSSDFTGLPVVDEHGRPLGMLTDGDLLYRASVPIRVRLLAEFAAQELSYVKELLAGRQVSEIMSAPAVTVLADQRLSEAVETMLKRGLRRLPVVDAEGVLVGILARRDIFQAISREAPDSRRLAGKGISVGDLRRAGDAMLPGTPTAAPDTPLERVIELLGNSAVERVAVVDAEGRLLGLISDRALLGAFAEHKQGLWDYLVRKVSAPEPDEAQAELARHYQRAQAGQIMEKDFPSVGEDTPLEEAARLMTEKRIKRLPVLDPQGRLRGMLSREALLRLGSGQAAGCPGCQSGSGRVPRRP
jgi:CBS domain-containing protein